jgi:hypothetical protein
MITTEKRSKSPTSELIALFEERGRGIINKREE